MKTTTTPRPPRDPATLAPAELARAIAAADAESSVICSAFIASGRGHELPTQTRLLADPLALRWQAHARRCADLRAEKDRRVTYHGSLRRIPAPAY